MGITKAKKRKNKAEQKELLENMTAKEYLKTATEEYLSGMAVIAENVQEGESFGLVEAVVPIGKKQVLKLKLELMEIPEEALEEKSELTEEEFNGKLNEFGLVHGARSTEEA